MFVNTSSDTNKPSNGQSKREKYRRTQPQPLCVQKVNNNFKLRKQDLIIVGLSVGLHPDMYCAKF